MNSTLPLPNTNTSSVRPATCGPPYYTFRLICCDFKLECPSRLQWVLLRQGILVPNMLPRLRKSIQCQHGHDKVSTRPHQSVNVATTMCQHGHNNVSSRPQQSVNEATSKCHHGHNKVSTGHNKASTRPQPTVIRATTKCHHGHRLTQSNNLDDKERTDYIHCEANVDNST